MQTSLTSFFSRPKEPKPVQNAGEEVAMDVESVGAEGAVGAVGAVGTVGEVGVGEVGVGGGAVAGAKIIESTTTQKSTTFSPPSQDSVHPITQETPSPLRRAQGSQQGMVTGPGVSSRVVAPESDARSKRRRKDISYAEDSDGEDNDPEDDFVPKERDASEIRRKSKAPRKLRRILDSDSDDEFVPPDAEEEDDDISSEGLVSSDDLPLPSLAPPSASSAPSAPSAPYASSAPSAPSASGVQPMDVASSSSSTASTRNPLDAFKMGASSSSNTTTTTSSSASTTSRMMMMSTKEIKRAEKKKVFEAKNKGRYPFLENVRDANRIPEGEEGYDPTTLYINPAVFTAKGKNKLTNFEKQYWAIKKDLYDTILFVQKGKFYELFEKDADIAHQVLGLKMTDRTNMRMCGVPEMHFQKWAAQLIALGYKVARVAQSETKIGSDIARKEGTKSASASLIRRELKEVLTSGTVVNEDMLGSADARFLMAVVEGPVSPTGRQIGVAFVDCATGKFSAAQLDDDDHLTLLETVLVQIKPVEILYEKNCLSKEVLSLLRVHIPLSSGLVALVGGSSFWDGAKAASWSRSVYSDPASIPASLTDTLDNGLRAHALGGLFAYLHKMQRATDLVSQGSFTVYDVVRSAECMVMDGQTLFNLNVLNNSVDGSTRGTLYELAMFCVSPFGKRRFRHELSYPLVSASAITLRQNAVEVLRSSSELTEEIERLLRALPDVERLISRIHSGSCPLPKFLDVLDAFDRTSRFATSSLSPDSVAGKALQNSELLAQIIQSAFPPLRGPLAEMATMFDRAYAREQGKIKPNPGVHPEYDQLSARRDELQAGLHEHLREIKSSISRDAVFVHRGKEMFQIEVPVKTSVPKEWHVKSTTKAKARYWSPYLEDKLPELDELEERLRLIQLSLLKHFEGLFDVYYSIWATAVDALAMLDVLLSLKSFSLALAEPKSLPTLVDNQESSSSNTAVPVLELKEVRHPCVRVTRASSFIPNDVTVGGSGPGGVLLTGPNMGGKSTLLRSVCVSVILAQMGAYVPAAAMRFSPVDRIFTRIGAHDHIMRGQSTFMVELLETASVLKHGTRNSLVIMDELGRGTSTFDGYAIAYAVLSHILTNIGARTLFSTHYHALCEEFASDPRVSLQHMTCYVDPEADEVTFLYKLAEGVASKSYGMNVAKLAGVESTIVDRATAKAKEFEMQSPMYAFRAEYSSLSAQDRSLFRQLAQITKGNENE